MVGLGGSDPWRWITASVGVAVALIGVAFVIPSRRWFAAVVSWLAAAGLLLWAAVGWAYWAIFPVLAVAAVLAIFVSVLWPKLRTMGTKKEGKETEEVPLASAAYMFEDSQNISIEGGSVENAPAVVSGRRNKNLMAKGIEARNIGVVPPTEKRSEKPARSRRSWLFSWEAPWKKPTDEK